MPEVPQVYRQQRLTPLSGVGNLSASDIAAATQGNRDLARSGEAITEFGIAFIEQKEKAEFHNQLNTARTEYLTKFFAYEQDLQTNADTETYIPNLKAGQTSSYKFTNKRAANEFELWKANEDLSQTRRVFGAKHDRDVKNYTDNWNLGIKEATRRTASAVSESDYQLELANGMDYFGLEYATEEKDGEPVPILDKKGNPTIRLIENWENPLLDTDEVRTAGYKSWKADADAKRKVKIQEQFKTSIEVQAFTIAANQGYPAAEAMLRDPATTADLIEAGMDRKDVRSLLNDVEERVGYKKANDELELEARRETQRDGINKLMYSTKDYRGTADAIEASELSEKEQGALLRENNTRARLAANGQDETNDPVAVDKISTAINQVGNDTLSLEDAKKVLKANKHLLKSEKVIEFTEELNKEFDRSIDTAYSRVRGDVRLRAIGKTESALDRLIEGLVNVKPGEQKSLEDRISTARVKFTLELDNFNRWEDSMRAWRRTNNEASPEEIQKEGMRSWVTEYSGKTPEQLKAASELEKANLSRVELTPEPSSDFDFNAIESTPNAKTVIPDDVQKILQETLIADEPKQKSKPKPPVRMQGPDGRTGTIPSDQVEKAISLGWKKI